MADGMRWGTAQITISSLHSRQSNLPVSSLTHNVPNAYEGIYNNGWTLSDLFINHDVMASICLMNQEYLLCDREKYKSSYGKAFVEFQIEKSLSLSVHQNRAY